LTIKNDSRIPCEYEFRIPEKFKKEIMFDPMRNILRPNEEVKVSCTFTPVKKREYQISLPLQVSSIYDVAKDKIGYYNPGSGANYKLSDALQRKSTKYEVCIVGAGSDGSVKISPT
jgi:hypothetical protein